MRRVPSVLAGPLVLLSTAFIPAAAAQAHASQVVWWNLPQLCAHVVSSPGTSPALAQTVGRSDHQRLAALDVRVSSTVELDMPRVVSCAFVDGNGNGVRDSDERVQGHVVRLTALGPRAFEYDRRLVADASSSVCVVTAVFDHGGLGEPQSSAITCVVNPSPMVPEAAVPAMLGLVALIVVGLVVWRLGRRRLATATEA